LFSNFLLDPSTRFVQPTSRTTIDKDSRGQNKGLTPPSPKSLTTDLNKSFVINTNEQDSPSDVNDPIYGNIQSLQRIKKQENIIENEGDLIEHDLLSLVEEEQQRDIPPALPTKRRAATINTLTTTQDTNNLDVNIEPTVKLVHPGKDRPRRSNVRRPIKRSANGATNDSSSDDGLLTDDNSQGDILPKSTNEIEINPQTSESSPS